MEIRNNTSTRLSELDTRSKTEARPGVEQGQAEDKGVSGRSGGGDAVSSSTERSYVSLAKEAVSPERQALIDKLRGQVERGEYAPKAEEISQAIVEDLLGRKGSV